MNILLIKAGEYSKSGILSKISFPLGIMYLASMIKDKHQIKLIDLRLMKDPVKVILEREKDFKPDLIGISGVSAELQKILELAYYSKLVFHNPIIVIGGPHVSSFPHEVLSEPYIDLGVIGEGEIVFKELIETIEQGKSYDSIRGIAYKQNGKIFFTPNPEYIQSLDDIPFPSWEFVNIDKYAKLPSFSDHFGKTRYMNILTSRGCPFKCIFCYHGIYGKAFRVRSPINVLEEIQTLKKRYNVQKIEVLDDVFNFNLPRAKKILELIIKEGIDVELSFPTGLRVDLIDEEFLVMLKKAGTKRMNISIEVGSERMQRFIKKNINLDKAQKTIELANKIGIFTTGMFLIGFPTETKEEMLETIDFAKRSYLNQAFFFTPFPFYGTDLYNFSKNKVALQDSTRYTENNFFISKNPINISEINDKELQAIIRYAYRRFYISFKRIIYLLKIDPKRFFYYFPLLLLEFFKIVVPKTLFKIKNQHKAR